MSAVVKLNPIKEETKEILILTIPNLGQPLILEIDRKLKKRKFQTDILFIGNDFEIELFKKSIQNQISIVPLFDYKWSYKLIFRKREKGIFSKWREKRLKKKRKKFLGDKLKSIIDKGLNLEQLKKLKSRLHRGNPIFPKLISVGKVSINTIADLSYLKNIQPQEILVKNHVFGDLNQFYKAKIEFKIGKEVIKFLKERNFVMFDIHCPDNRINYHSLVITKQKWQDFTFIHATDLHLAERNDKLFEIIKKWTETSVKESVENFFEEVRKKLKIKKEQDKKEKLLSEIKIPLRKRLINPNNQLRKFIKLMNRKVLKNELDFIVLTGDLVDYTILSRFAKKLRKLNEFRYEDSNWQVFKNIILNIPSQEKHKGIIRSEELNCPIFTILGNHDYRPFHYDLTWGNMYNKIGLNASEAVALNELFSASPITALTKTSLALRGYLSEINPSRDFSMKLGNNLFIFLNTGGDSFRNVRDLLTGHPSLTGITTKQIKFLENLMNNEINKSMNTFLFLHGPPLNPEGRKLTINIFEKKGSRFVRQKLSDFKESVIKSFGKALSKARIDGVFNTKYGCVSSNWEKLVEFCKNFTILTLSGHTHISREFRLDDPGEFKTSVFDAPPFRLKKIENPAAIFYDDYSNIYDNPKEISENGPFVVQTPALGLGSYGNPKSAGGYREIIVKNGELASFKIKSINR
ncbi:MAG: metallophosphoesterase family protein [Promethearchaeota archaeon]